MAISASTTRRAALIGAAASCTALAVPAVALAKKVEAAENPDAELLRLGAEFERLWQIERSKLLPMNSDDSDWEPWDAAFEQTKVVADKIAVTSATSLAGFRVKARAFLWCHQGDDEFDREGFGSATDERLAAGIIGDLLATA